MHDDLADTIEDIIAAASNWLETHCGEPVPEEWQEAYRAMRSVPPLLELLEKMLK